MLEVFDIEKRNDIRAELNQETQFRVLSNGESETALSPMIGIAKNISRGGVCIQTEQKINEGNVIRVEIPAPGSSKNKINAFCEVQWCRKSFVTGYYEIGLSFIAMKEDDVEYLRQYVETHQRAM